MANTSPSGSMPMFHFNKPTGPMHDDIRRAVEELEDRNNPHLAITFLNTVLENTQFAAHASTPTPTPSPSASATGSGVAVAGRVPASGSAAAPARASVVTGVVTGSVAGRGVTKGRVTGVVSGSATATSSSAGLTPSSSFGQSGGNPPRRALEQFNAIQLERLLLLRADAYAMTLQHEKSLKDAQAAVEVSGGSSPFAYFTVGRQHRYLWAIEDAVLAFNTAEGLVASVTQEYLKQRGVSEKGNSFSAMQCLQMAVWNSKSTSVSDEDFWASHGLSPQEVKELGLTRAEYEQQQAELLRSREEHRLKCSISNSRSDCPHESQHSTWRCSSPPQPSSTPLDDSGVHGNTTWSQDEMLSDLEMMTLFGVDQSEMAAWRKMSTECKALMAVNVHQTIPISSLHAALTTLWPKVNAVRSGIILTIDNSTSLRLKYVGSTLNGAGHLQGHSFPQVIPKGSVGIVLLQSTSWSGYNGSLCFEVADELCCFLYFDIPVLASKKVGVRLLEHRSGDLKVAFDEVNGENSIFVGPNGRPLPRVAATTAGVRAVKMPVNSVWRTNVSANSARRRVKVTGSVGDNRGVHFVIAEIPSVPLTPVDILPALEYVGPGTLKKMSAVSRAYRDVINHLPPQLFSSQQRSNAFPDYLLQPDRFSSPWTVRDCTAVTWKLVTETRGAERLEFSLSDPTNPNATPLLSITSDTLSRDGTFMFGDSQRRHVLMHIVDHWGLFVNNVFYCETPLGNHFASISSTPQGHFQLVFNAFGNRPEQVLYTARKHHTTVVSAAGRVTSFYSDPNNPSAAPTASRAISTGTVVSAEGRRAGVGRPPAPHAGASDYFSNPTGGRLVEGGTAATGGGAASVTHREVYSVWCPKQECGAALLNCPPQNTNNGEEIAAEITVLPHPVGRRVPVAEVKVFPGADVLLVSMLAFVIVRW